MPTFGYKRKLEMEPRPGVKYATVYIKQSPEQYQAFRAWLHNIGEAIVDICSVDPALAQWFTRPMPDFRRSVKGEYYSPHDLLTDMLTQLALQRDLTEAMIGRWNRLTESTPWQIQFVADREQEPTATVRF